MRRICALLLVVGLVFCLGGDLFAQDRRQSKEKRRQQMEIVRMWRMMEALDLNKETADKIYQIRKRFLAERNKLRADLRQEFAELRRRLEASSQGSDDKELAKLLKSVKEKRVKLRTLWENQYDEVSKVLTTRQQAKLMVFLIDFKQEFARMMRMRRERRLGPPNRDRQGPPPRGAPHFGREMRGGPPAAQRFSRPEGQDHLPGQPPGRPPQFPGSPPGGPYPFPNEHPGGSDRFPDHPPEWEGPPGSDR